MITTFQQHPATAAETASEYLGAGLHGDGSEVLSKLVAAAPDKTKLNAVALYYLAHFAAKQGQTTKAAEYGRLAAQASPDYVFPFQWETIEVLRGAMERDQTDARAPYYLGNLLYDWQPDEAVRHWETSARLDESNAIVHRNLAVAWAHRKSGVSLDRAIANLEKAVSLDRKYAMHFAELDELYEAAGAAPEKRLTLLERNRDVVAQRDDAQARAITMKVVAGEYDEAIALLQQRRFAVWEGGSLNVADSWMDAHILKGRELLAANQSRLARDEFEAARNLPENLPAERRGGLGREAEIAYWIGAAEDAAGNADQARKHWTAAAQEAGSGRRGEGELDLTRGVQRYYQALALARLGQTEKATAIFRELVNAGEQGRSRAAQSDFFTSFGEQQNQRARLSSANFVAGLGHLGLKNQELARAAFAEAVKVNPSHLGARAELR